MTSRIAILFGLTALLLCWACSSEDEIIQPLPPDLEVSPLGADDPDCINGFIEQMPRSEEFFIQGELNGESFDLDSPFFNFPDQCGTFFTIGGLEYDKCGQIEFGVQFVLFDETPRDISRIDNPNFGLTFNFGAITTPVTTPPFDSLITSQGIENFIEIDFLSADSTFMEGTFEFHAIKKANTWSRETEPEEIRIRNGIFRLRNVCD